MSQKSALKKTRGLGSAKDGTAHFIKQRVTAVALLPLVGWFLYTVMSLVGADYETARGFIAQPFNAVMFLLLILAAFTHLRLGVQVVIEDYIDGEGTKLALLMLNNFFAIAIGAACAFAVLKTSLGA